MDVDKFKGMGALAIPVLFKASLALSKQQSMLFAINFGAGAQWTLSEIYAVSTEFQNPTIPNTFFITYIAEVGLSIGAIDEQLKNSKDLSFYLRFGTNLKGGMTFNCGLRVSFWNGLLK